MIIVKLQGGLGNQMFQYAVGRAIGLRTGLKVAYDIEAYKEDVSGKTPKLQSILKSGLLQKHTVRPLGLQNFNTIIVEADSANLATHLSTTQILFRKILARLSPTNWYKVDKNIFTPKDNTYLQGWWQTEEYFKNYADIIRSEFSLKNSLGATAQSFQSKIIEVKQAESTAVSIHIRRGDYVTNTHAATHHGVLAIEYYQKALKEILKKESKPLHLFVFSDDIEWARGAFNQESLHSEYPIYFVSSPEIKDYEELYLMSLCAHNIIANSTFSWWSAWLNNNQNKIVIAPKDWVKNPHIDTSSALPTNWIKI